MDYANLNPQTIFFALVGGVFPALVWLWFWLQEDRLHPEPRRLILRTFIFGMLAVLIVLPIEKYILSLYPANERLYTSLWACTEELFKFLAAFLAALDTREFDEPIDAFIYLITAALGFAALENAFFLYGSVDSVSVASTVVTGGLRFIGATLLHVLTSGLIGFFIGIAYYRGWFLKHISLALGTALAIILHTLFNIYIMKSEGTNIFIVFSFVWVGLLCLLVGLEKIKSIHPPFEQEI